MACGVKQPGVAASLMVNVESGSKQGSQDLPGFQNWQLVTHSREGRSGQRYGNLFQSRFYIRRDGFSGLNCALQIAANGILGHAPSLVKVFTKRADFRDGGDQNVVPAFRHPLKNDRVIILTWRSVYVGHGDSSCHASIAFLLSATHKPAALILRLVGQAHLGKAIAQRIAGDAEQAGWRG